MNQGIKQLLIQTASLIAGFMVWPLISSLMPFIEADLEISPSQTASIIAVPLVLGSLFRIPAGYLTDRFGARRLLTISFLILAAPILMVKNADSPAALLIAGIFLGLGGGVFSVGVTSLPKYFPNSRHGLVNGIYGIGSVGTALSAFLSPILASWYGWRTSAQIFIFLVLLFAVINFFFGDRNEKKAQETIKGQMLKVYKNKKLWVLSFFYFVTFGSFIAFSVYLPIFLVKNFSLLETDAGMRTAVFIILGITARVAGGLISDKINPYYVLMFSFTGLSFAGLLMSFTPSLPIFSFGCLLVSICSGMGNGAIFKLVPLYFFRQAGFVNGLVTAVGGLGGFFPPMIVGAMYTVTGHYAIGFMSLSEISLASAIIVAWLFYYEKQSISEKIIASSNEGLTLTDPNGIIQKVNPAFTRITGYTLNEVVGKTPSVLQSGEHDNEFYRKMWYDLKTKGHWEGLIWNKRKNGEIYKEYLSIRSISDSFGETINYVGTFREIE